MQILLTVPKYTNTFRMDIIEDTIYDIRSQHELDLIVFPEGYECVNSVEELLQIGKQLSENYNAAILMGSSVLENQSEWAVYFNAHATDGETRSKLYCKHSTAKTTAFMLENYEEMKEEFYKPVFYKDKTLQFNICHDIYLPLLTEKLMERKCDYFINLTGGNVKMSKWHNLFKGRSLESDTIYLCTMGDFPERKQQSYPFVYINGDDVIESVSYRTREEAGPSRYSLYDFSDFGELRAYDHSTELTFSKKQYDDFTVGFDKAEADVTIESEPLRVIVNELPHYKENVHFKITKNEENINVYELDYKDLFNRKKLYKLDMDDQEHQIIVYKSSEWIDVEEAMALSKLRAIENRVGIIVAAPNAQFGIRTNRYKDIQVFQPSNQVIGFSFEFMYGYHSTFNKANNGQYVGVREKDAYLSLGKNESLLQNFFE